MATVHDTLPAGHEYLTVRQLATLLQMVPRTVYRLCDQGRLPGRKIGHAWRFHRGLIDAWVRGEVVIPTPPMVRKRSVRHATSEGRTREVPVDRAAAV